MKMKWKLALMVVLPMIICSITVAAISVNLSKKHLNEEQKTILKVALEGYSGDVEAFLDQNVDMTVFEGDTRVESSIDGVEGTQASNVVVEKVINNGEEYFDTNVDVHGVAYYGYYVPTEEGMLFAGKPQTIVANNMKNLMIYVILSSCGLLVICGIMGYLMAAGMAKQIRGATMNLVSIANGNLAIEKESRVSKSKDEINEIDRSTRHMAEELYHIIMAATNIGVDVSESSEELGTTSDNTLSAMNEVSKAIEEIAGGLQGQSESVQSIAENISGINEDVDRIKTSANDISDCSVRLDSRSNLMKEKMTSMSESNQKVNSSMGEITDKIQAIAKVIESVKGIAAVIGDISSQTKLLSLNASIEAARAGEAGKGFAVVADSISDLSEDTSKQVDEITNIINTLVEDFDECIQTMDSTVADGEEQKENLRQVMEEFENLSLEIEETSTKVQYIGEAIDKTAVEMLQISNEIEELSAISENSAASTQEVNASVEEVNALMNGVSGIAAELSSKAEELNQQLKFFKL